MPANSVSEASAFDLIPQAFYRDAARRCAGEIAAHYGDRLAAVYVWGSAARGEALPGVSDLELSIFIRDAYTDADRYEWRDKHADPRLTEAIPGFKGLPPATPIAPILEGGEGYRRDGVAADEAILARYYRGDPVSDAEKARIRSRATFYMVRYGGVLVGGTDPTAGIELPPPDAAWARGWTRSPREVANGAAGRPAASAGAVQQRKEFPLRGHPALRRRQLARLAVLMGAGVLMAEGRFRSYRGAEVPPALRAARPAWAGFLEETAGLYADLRVGGEAEVADYLTRLLPWMDEVSAELGAL